MAIRAVTNGLNHKIRNHEDFQRIFSYFVIPELLMLLASTDIDDYCIFIEMQPTLEGSKIIFHDGGSTYDPENDSMRYTYYKTISTEVPLSYKETLFYSIGEQIICLLEER